jgi:XTP/dITP diphosphohydrolase
VKLWCATGNPGKLREFRLAADNDPDVEFELVPDFKSLPPAVEDGVTFEENAIRKARHYARYVAGPIFADDSGLEVDALAGAPGVYSARYSGEHANDEANNQLLLANLHGVLDRTARFVCTIALVEGERLIGTWRGSVEGRILDAPHGSGGFGYDPLFFHPPFGCTFGEASAGRKLSVSHRGQALRAMLRDLKTR